MYKFSQTSVTYIQMHSLMMTFKHENMTLVHFIIIFLLAERNHKNMLFFHVSLVVVKGLLSVCPKKFPMLG